MLENNSNTQFIVMTMSDYMNMVHEAARNLVAVQSATSPSTTEMEDKYMTRQEVAKLGSSVKCIDRKKIFIL
jgi:hypothetical protein